MSPGMHLRTILLALCAAMLCGLHIPQARAQETLSLTRFNQHDVDWGAELRLIRDHFKLDRDQLAAVRLLLSGAMTEHQMQRRLHDRRRDLLDNQDETPQTKAALAAENQRFAQHRLKIESGWLTEVKELILTPSQLSGWADYERARRIDDAIRTFTDPQLLITNLLAEADLTPQELAAAQPAVDLHLQALDDAVKKYLAIKGQWLAIRWGMATGDPDKVEEARAAAGAGLIELMRTGLRQVCGVIPPEKAETIKVLFELRQARDEYGLAKLVDDFPFSDMVKISTLTPEQRTRIDAAAATGDKDMLKAARVFYEARKTINDDWNAYQKLRHQYNMDTWKVRRNVFRLIREILTDDQRRAFDDGTEPPVSSDDLYDRYYQEDHAAAESWDSGR